MNQEKKETLPDPPKRKRGRPRKGQEITQQEKDDRKKTKQQEKIDRKIEAAKRGINRFRIQAITEDGVKLYYIDKYVYWSLNKKRSLQIYGKEYAEEIAQKLSKEPIRYQKKKLFISIKPIRISAKDIDEKYFIENVYEDESYFKRGYIKKYQKASAEIKKERLKKIVAGDYKYLSEKDRKALEKRKEKIVKMRAYRKEKADQKRDRRIVRNEE